MRPCCYRSAVVCVSVCLLVSTMSCAKTAEPIEMPFGAWTRVSPTNRVQVLDENPAPPGEPGKGQLGASVGLL